MGISQDRLVGAIGVAESRINNSRINVSATGRRAMTAEGQFIGWIESVDGPPLSMGLQESGGLQSSHVTMGVAGDPLPRKEIIG